MTEDCIEKLYGEAIAVLKDCDERSLLEMGRQVDFLLAVLPKQPRLLTLRGRINGEFRRRP